MNELIRYLLANMILDFQGEISLEQVRSMLRGDGGREAKSLLEKLTADSGIEDMLVTLADTLRDHIPHGISEAVVKEQLQMYSES